MKTLYERLRYRLRMLRLGWTIKPIAGGAGDGGEGGEGGEGKAEPDPKDPTPARKDPPWGSEDDFSPERAWNKIQAVEGDKKKLRDQLAERDEELKQFRDANKSDQEKLEERASTAAVEATKATAEAARLRVALKKGLSETQAKRLVGETEEELEQDAEDLLESFRDADGEQGSTPRRPRERLRPGAAPGAEPEPNDPAELAKSVSRDW